MLANTRICILAATTFLLFGGVYCWQNYVDDQLLGADLIEAAIIGADGSEIWAKSPNFNLSPNEIKKLAEGFRNAASFFATGISLNGQKYLTIKADGQSVYGKKGAGGAICVKTSSAIIIGIYDDKLQPGNAANIVEKLGDYLRENGY